MELNACRHLVGLLTVDLQQEMEPWRCAAS